MKIRPGKFNRTNPSHAAPGAGSQFSVCSNATGGSSPSLNLAFGGIGALRSGGGTFDRGSHGLRGWFYPCHPCHPWFYCPWRDRSSRLEWRRFGRRFFGNAERVAEVGGASGDEPLGSRPIPTSLAARLRRSLSRSADSAMKGFNETDTALTAETGAIRNVR